MKKFLFLIALLPMLCCCGSQNNSFHDYSNERVCIVRYTNDIINGTWDNLNLFYSTLFLGQDTTKWVITSAIKTQPLQYATYIIDKNEYNRIVISDRKPI